MAKKRGAAKKVKKKKVKKKRAASSARGKAAKKASKSPTRKTTKGGATKTRKKSAAAKSKTAAKKATRPRKRKLRLPISKQAAAQLPRSTIPKWLVEKDAEEVLEHLRRTWVALQFKEVLGLVAHVMSYTPEFVQLHGERCSLVLSKRFMPSSREPEGYSDEIWLDVYSIGRDFTSELERIGYGADRTLREFLSVFNGMAESPPSLAGFFIPVRDWQPIAQYFGAYYSEIQAGADWEKGLVIYHALNGDQLVLKPDGSLGWLVLELFRVKNLCKSFAQFLKRYISIKKTGWPLDSWGPR